MTLLLLTGSLSLLIAGIWLSAFFSGSETAFYRVSALRVAVEAEDGDSRARSVLRFLRRPADFVATVLVGNSVANYLVTVAIGLLLAAVLRQRTTAGEIVATLCLSPVVFLFGELVPKNVNYVQPLRSLLGKVRLFELFHRLLRPLSWPIVQVTRSLGQGEASGRVMPLARHQLGDLIEQGSVEGCLPEWQVRLGRALLEVGAESIITDVEPVPHEAGLSGSMTVAEAIAVANRTGQTWLVVRETDRADRWAGSVPIGELLKADDDTPIASLVRPMPHLREETTRLAAGRIIREGGGGYAIVLRNREYVGLLSLEAVLHPLLAAAEAGDSTATSPART